MLTAPASGWWGAAWTETWTQAGIISDVLCMGVTKRRGW